MKLPEELKSVSLNVENGELIVNGELLQGVFDFSLDFRNGEWSMSLQQTKRYVAMGKEGKEREK